MYVLHNIEVRSCNHCRREGAKGVTYSERVSVALGNQRERRVRHIVVCGLSGFTIFSHINSQTARFSGVGGNCRT